MATTNINVRVDFVLKNEYYRADRGALELFLFRTGTHSDLF